MHIERYIRIHVVVKVKKVGSLQLSPANYIMHIFIKKRLLLILRRSRSNFVL